MSALKLNIVASDIRDHHGVRIQQGQVHVGPESQVTYLRSCVCVGFYHSGRHLGALSHITGFSENSGHGVKGALREIERCMSQEGLRLEDCECFVIGGTDNAQHVFDSVIHELRQRRLKFRELDVLGSFHRKLRLNPSEGTVELFKKSTGENTPEAASAFCPDTSLQRFYDRRRRLITGASVFFRNEALLKELRDTIIPEVLSRFDRCHIWCAGCSTGMEAYSIGMVALDSLIRSNKDQFELRILGTDISEEALEQGRLGEYIVTDRAGDPNASFFQRYCERTSARTIRIGSELRPRVSFRNRDIREGSRQHLFELVVCDHVLQYFPIEVQLEFLRGLITGVRPGGFLFVSSPSSVIQETLLASGDYRFVTRSLFRSTIERASAVRTPAD